MTHRNDAWPVVKTLRPGQPGTLKLHRQHGPALVCVRYREDPVGQTRRITVELIVEDKPVRHRTVWVTIPADRSDLRASALARGATWHPQRKNWRMNVRTAKLLHLHILARTENIQT
jgi:hypothetical protein